MPFFPLGKVGDPLKLGSYLDARNIRGGTITAQELIIAGGTQGVIRSQNLDQVNNVGWAIWGDGSAFFGGSVTFGGDIYSNNWDGDNPVDLSSTFDSGATTGFALDSSAGASQWMGDVFFGDSVIFVPTSGFSGGVITFNASFQTDPGRISALGVDGGGGPGNTYHSLGMYPPYDETDFYGRIDLASSGQSALAVFEQAINLEIDGEGGSQTTQHKRAVQIWAPGGADPSDEMLRIVVPSTDPDALVIADNNLTTLAKWNEFGRVVVDDGAASTPGLSFWGDQDTGLFSHASNEIGFATGGAEKMVLRGDILYGQGGTGGMSIKVDGAGSAASPTYSFRSDDDTGIYRRQANYLGFATAGVEAGYIDLNQNWEFGGNILYNLSAVRAANGSAGAPAYTFNSDTNTGMYTNGTTLFFVWNGTVELGLRGNIAEFPAVGDNTTGGAANVYISGSGSHVMERSTSRLEYKPGWQYADEEWLADLELPRAITWEHRKEYEGRPAEPANEEAGFPGTPAVEDYVLEETMLGFGVEHVYEMLPMAATDKRDDGEPDNYDVRSLVAVLSAKVKRLERQVKELSASR